MPCFTPAAADALRCQCRPALQGDSGTDAFRCVEMREGQPWLWQADAYGAAATVHTLLYGRYMEVERVRENATGGWVLLGGCCRDQQRQTTMVCTTQPTGLVPTAAVPAATMSPPINQP